MGGVAVGSPVSAANTNSAFLEKNDDDTTVGRVTLANALSVSGSTVDNTQRELNSESSYTGNPLNSAKNNLPVWTDTDAGSGTDNLTQRAEALTKKFNPSLDSTHGHSHNGTAGQGPNIQSSDLAGTVLQGFFIQGTDLTGVTGTSTTVTTQLSGIPASLGQTQQGAVVTAPNNTVGLVNSSTGTEFVDGSGRRVYGRLSFSGSVYTLSYYVNIAGVETAYSFSSSPVRWFYQQLFNPIVNGPVYSPLINMPSLDTVADVPAATTSLQGKTLLSSSAAADVGSSGSAGTANATVANADHVHRGIAAFLVAAGTTRYGTITLTPGTNIAITDSSGNYTIAITGQIAIGNGGTGASTKAAAFDALSPMTTGGDLIYGGASGTGTRLANGSAGQFLKSNGTTTAPSWANVAASYAAPTFTSYASGSGTYTTPAGALYLKVMICGGGGGGGACGTGGSNGGNGTASTFGSSFLTANGGSNGNEPGTNSGQGGNGGTASLGSASGLAISGGKGQGGGFSPAGSIIFPGGAGGTNALGGAGAGAQEQAGTDAASGTGAGGGGGSPTATTLNSAGGGGAGGYIYVDIVSPSATYSYSVGGGGGGGTGGTNGTNGGNGGSGFIRIWEYYQ